MDPATLLTILGWFAQPAAQALFNTSQTYVQQRLGLSSSPSLISQVEPLLDKYLQKLIARLDEDRIAKLYGAFSKLRDAPKSVARQSLLSSALDGFHEVARIPEQGTTGEWPNAELRCMAFIGMVASYTLLQDRAELIEEKMIEAVSANAATAEQWLGRDLVREIVSRFPPPEIICPKCGFRNSAGSLFCNKDGYSLTQSQNSAPQHLSQIPQTKSIVQTFNPVDYYPVKSIWEIHPRMRDTGILVVHNNSLEFQGKKGSVLITHVRFISIEWKIYVKVIYGDSSTLSTAFFCDAGIGRLGSILGGSKLIADTLQKAYFS